ncbi:MAG: bifunctional UDP-sugar hydrolase/5'-nucleotidase [Ignavibacteriales bacterium]|nr:bifunctional UDP-sugar hydrolase/5'-nucleotidase [Ignavibacteriales bacterium]
MNHLRSLRFLFLLLVTAGSLSSQPKQLVILHTNDIHSSFVPHEAAWIKENPKPMVGGFNELSYVIDSLRKVKGDVLLLDAGDIMTGNPITDYVYQDAEGGAIMEMMNRVGYDAWCPGNHDLDISMDHFGKLSAIAKFPTLCANMQNDKGALFYKNKPSIIITKNGLRIGIIGIISQELYSLVNQNNLVGVKVQSPTETLQKYANELRPQVDVVIALTHQGVDEDADMAKQLTNVDIIVGGHSHTRLKSPRTVNGIVIVQAGSNCENLGILEVTVDHQAVTKSSGQLLQLWYTSRRPATELSQFIDSYKKKIDNDYSEVIATANGDLKRGENGGSSLINFVADATRETALADVGYINIHGVRKDVSAGNITKRDLFEVMPFRNVLVTFQLTGAQLKASIENCIRNKSGVQLSGVKCVWKKEGDGIVFTTFLVNGKPLDEKKNYIGAASDYLMGEAKRYIGFDVPNKTFSNSTIFSAILTKARAMKTFDSKDEFRIEQAR